MVEQARLLVVEDEKNVGLTLIERLKKEGYLVTWASSQAAALAEIDRGRFNLALLDVGLPDGSGFAVAEHLRKVQPGAAVIFLTAFGNPEDRVRGLELGAEDYIVKPFHLKELMLRIQNGLKRAEFLAERSQTFSDPIQLGKATIYFSKFQAAVDGETVSLTHKEVALLKLLLERKGDVVSRDEILDHVWSADEFPTSRTVDNFIMRIRKLVETDTENPKLIKSVRGVGYQLV